MSPASISVVTTGKFCSIRSRRGADETLFDLEHTSNFLTLTGASAYCWIDGLTIANGAGVTTGGIETLSENTELLIFSSVLRNNVATGTGVAGGALTVRGSLECASTAFLFNTSAGKGGAIAIAGDSTNVAYHDLVLCTFRGNMAAHDGGALWAEGTATVPQFVRDAVYCVFWGNAARAGSQDQIGEAIPGNFHVSASDVQGGWSGLGSHNLDIDPLFAFPKSFHLSVGTPVLGLAGGLICTVGPIDADGQPRDCSESELGADEVLPVTLASVSDTAADRLEFAVAGATPGLPVLMLVGEHLVQPPIATPFGALEIQPDALRILTMNAVSVDGTSTLHLGVGAAVAGTDLVLQALVGTALLPATTVQLP
jgi:hypothetical protein